MKLIIAYIQPFMVDKLSRALLKAPVGGYTLSDAKGYGRATTDDSTDYHSPRVRVEIAVNDEHVDSVSDLILHTVGTHRGGDGMILVVEIQQAVSIKSGKRNQDALSPGSVPVSS